MLGHSSLNKHYELAVPNEIERIVFFSDESPITTSVDAAAAAAATATEVATAAGYQHECLVTNDE